MYIYIKLYNYFDYLMDYLTYILNITQDKNQFQIP